MKPARMLLAGGLVLAVVAVLLWPRSRAQVAPATGDAGVAPERVEARAGAPSSRTLSTPRPSLEPTPGAVPAEDGGALRRVGFRPLSDIREGMRASAEDFVSRLEAYRVQAELGDQQWRMLLHDLLEAAIEAQRFTESHGKDALGQRLSADDRTEAIVLRREELRARMSEYLTPKQLAMFEFRVDVGAAISATKTTEALRDEDHPELRLQPPWPEDGLTGPAVP